MESAIVEYTWQDLKEVAQREALTSSTKKRLSLFNSVTNALNLKEVATDDLQFVIKLIFLTYSLYEDHSSRMAVLNTFSALLAWNLELVSLTLTPLLKREVETNNMAISSYFTLLEWTNIVLSAASKDRQVFDTVFSDLVIAQAAALHNSLSDDNKKRLAHTAIRSTKVALVNVFTAIENSANQYLDILTVKSVKISHTSLLGVIASTVSELKSNQKSYQVIVDRKSDINKFYVREILGSKTAPGLAVASGLNPFFSEFLTTEELLNEISGPFERAILRAPDSVLGDVSLEFIKSIPINVDVSESILKHFISPLLSSFKSSKENVRENGLKTLTEFLKISINDDNNVKIANELIAPLKANKITVPDQRAMYAQALFQLPVSERLSAVIPAGLTGIAGRESNECALESIVSTFFQHLRAGLQNNITVDKNILEGIQKGLTDKKTNLRRFWIISFGDFLLLKIKKPAAVQFVKDTLPKVLESWKEVTANPLSAVQNKIVVAAFVLTAAVDALLALKDESITDLITKSKVVEAAFVYGSKPSFLLLDRIYTKLVSAEEQTWAIKALRQTASSLNPAKESGVAWALAFIYFITATSVPAEVRQYSTSELTNSYLSRPDAIGKVVIKALWQWAIQLTESDKKEQSVAISEEVTNRLRVVVQAITPATSTVPEEIRKAQLVDLIVLTHHRVFDKVQRWIALCQRVGIDPGQLALEKSNELKQAILVDYYREDASEVIIDASAEAASTLAFVDPQVITSFLKDSFVNDLDISRLNGIDEDHVQIWHTPDGVLYVDVLSKEREKYAVDKNSKDYATLKWEAEVRADLARKAGPIKKKLTKDEQIKVDAQLKKEKIIRANVQNAFVHVRRAVKLIHYLALGTANGSEVWFPAATQSLGEALRHNLALLIGPVGIETFLQLADNLSPRLGPLRRFIGVALLRALGVTDIPPNLTQESLQELITRVLYKLRFISEQIPLDAISLTYIIPLLLLVFKHKGIKCSDEEQADEQIELAIETLTFHVEVFANPLVQRTDVLKGVITLMELYPSRNKGAKESLLGLCQSISTNVTEEELSVLLQGSISDDSFVRATVLEGIDTEFDISYIGYSSELWIASHDEIELNSKLAASIWEENELSIDESTPIKLLAYLENNNEPIRNATASAISDALGQLTSDSPKLFHNFFAEISNIYRERSKPPPIIYDEFGMVVKSSLEQKDAWEIRSGIAATLKRLAPIFDKVELVAFVKFLIEDGPLGDNESNVRQHMQEAGVTILNLHAKSQVDSLMPIIEDCLAAKHTGDEVQDRVKECAIVLYGTLARHLDDDSRLPPIVDRLISTLRAPSENVQFAVSETMPPLVKRVDGDHIGKYIEKLLERLYTSNKYSERRGAAYGLAGIVKGVGISALADYDIIRSLTMALEDKKDAKKRQGVQFAFEILSLSLSRYFEPYVLEILPLLLGSLGDMSPEVREATADAAKEIMKHATSYGIKQLIPLVLDNFNQTAWRSKKGSVELLGTMAYLDPRQLSESLSQIIPEIVGALNDTHKEIRKAANLSLQRFGEVINNPEIQNLVPILLKAISDPTKYVDDALDALLKTTFAHYIDAPSLALIIYILRRGLKERSAFTKRKSCQIVGNMASLTDSRDLVPYLDTLVSELEISMVDPVPATRATASRALGSLIQKLGEEQMPNLIPKLVTILRADNNAGDRLGAAQALSEVVSGLGVRKLEELLPIILKNVSSPKANIRESFMNLMVFLPAAFGNNFSPYLSNVIPPILAGLADDVETIRDISLRAGRLIVKNYATRSVDLLLPELERGLSDENFRIRLSSVELTGDLLFQITGINGKSASADVDEEDENVGGEVHSSLKEVLGVERRDRVLAALYLCRSDVTALVRNAAVDVWKSLVPNTPRTVKDILPVLSQLIIRRLSSNDEDQRENASSTLSDLVKRFGDNMLPQFLPTLESGLFAGDADAKQGICLALSELIEASPLQVLESHEKTLIGFVKSALVDTDAGVREAAAHTFDTLQDAIGDRAIDQVLPQLLNLLQTSGQSEYALAALKEIMSTKSEVIFPVLMPILLTSPISPFNARALSSLAEVAGSSLYRRLDSIIQALFDTLIDTEEGEAKTEINASVDRIIASIDDEEELELVMDIFIGLVQDEEPRKRALSFEHMATYFDSGDADEFAAYASLWISNGLASLSDDNKDVVTAAWKCLSTLVSKLAKESLLELVVSTCKQLQQLDKSELAGFSLPKGPNCLLPIFSQGLMYGSSLQREYGARGIAGIVERTPGAVLRPFVTHMVGPLIRTVGERFPAEVKTAILEALSILLAKIPAFLRPFLPQLQRTFTKSLSDPSSEALQASAQKALDVLNSIQK
ncbi:armadillo-type protein [Lipomyces japonicus]|uniref:armadillo-type protein n=1 Tax=Lipomyces japonicus TaxID=56871 RepID=UPI0034CF055B